MAKTYSQIKTGLDEIAERIVENRKRLANAYTLVTTAESDLSNMNTQYLDLVTDIDTAATNNPDDAAYQAAKAEKDAMVTEFQALKSEATATKNAMDSA